MKCRDLNDSQRRAMRRIVRYLRDTERYNGVTSVRWALIDAGCFVSATFKTRRSDCGEASMRQIMCEHYIHVHIGKRGRITLHAAREGISTDEGLKRKHTEHVAYMIRAGKIGNRKFNPDKYINKGE